jgi:hypothetical protein
MSHVAENAWLSGPLLPPPPPGGRRKLDASGHWWNIFERDARAVPGSTNDRCLIVDGGYICRRLWHYPDNWRELDVDELLQLPVSVR